jgi:hypothetical protein
LLRLASLGSVPDYHLKRSRGTKGINFFYVTKDNCEKKVDEIKLCKLKPVKGTTVSFIVLVMVSSVDSFGFTWVCSGLSPPRITAATLQFPHNSPCKQKELTFYMLIKIIVKRKLMK